jgi:hypothetical protein
MVAKRFLETTPEINTKTGKGHVQTARRCRERFAKAQTQEREANDKEDRRAKLPS